MFGSLGFPEILMIFVVVILLFGPKKLPEFAKMFGKFVRDVRSTVDKAKETISEEIDLDLNVDTELLPPEKETETESSDPDKKREEK